MIGRKVEANGFPPAFIDPADGQLDGDWSELQWWGETTAAFSASSISTKDAALSYASKRILYVACSVYRKYLAFPSRMSKL